ncbi:ribosomal S8 family protein [Aulographum hederae CBS 113979]|uniref:Ribosomal S8 family protein n=1 Tax=Aulographum hederae CBS 113979 TaxID=1176131 RepID=A0A6G1HAW0_9PEZI|nr:ribosomal S8 family protein [Aulographum hederae CBS 113979]
MSLANLAHMCSHLQNVSRARLAITSVPMTKLHLNLALALQKQGFISSVQLGGNTPPKPPSSNAPPLGFQSADIKVLEEEPWRIYPDPKYSRKSGVPEPQYPKKVAERRLWLGMKYYNSEPVLNRISLVSKPTKRITLDWKRLRAVTQGEDAAEVKGLNKPGECLFLGTDRGFLESRECVERYLGGLLYCRVS